MRLLYSLKMCPNLENIRKRSDKNSCRNWPLLWSFHIHVSDSKCRKHRKMWNRSFAVAAIYRHSHQLQAPPCVIQHSARYATFVPDQRTRKPNSSVMGAIILCAKSTAKGCATNARCKSWTYNNDTICKIIRKSHMKCCGILYAFCNTFSAYFSVCFYIFESS